MAIGGPPAGRLDLSLLPGGPAVRIASLAFLAFLAFLASVVLAAPASSTGSFVAFELAPWGGACPQGHFFALNDLGQVFKGTWYNSGCGPYLMCGQPPTTDKAVDLTMADDGALWVLTAG